jgi:hypothetical protein
LAIECIHCCLDAVGHERQGGVCGSIQDLGEVRTLVAPEVLQHIGRRIHAPGRPANPDAQARKAFASEAFNRGGNPFLAAWTPTWAQSESTQRQVQIIVRDEQAVKRDSIVSSEALDGLP